MKFGFEEFSIVRWGKDMSGKSIPKTEKSKVKMSGTIAQWFRIGFIHNF